MNKAHHLLVWDLYRQANDGYFSSWYGVDLKLSAEDIRSAVNANGPIKRKELAERLHALFGPGKGHEHCFTSAERHASEFWIAPKVNSPDYESTLAQHAHVNLIEWYRRLALIIDCAVDEVPNLSYPR